MSEEIKVGDLIYRPSDASGEETVFQVAFIDAEGDFWNKIKSFVGECILKNKAIKLIPLKSTEGVKNGDRLVSLMYLCDNLKRGDITEVTNIEYDSIVTVSACPSMTWNCSKFAKIPSFGAPKIKKRKACFKDDKTSNDSLNEKDFIACPSPGLLGVWEHLGSGYRVTWEFGMFIAQNIRQKDRVFYNWKPLNNWEQIEPAPFESRSHKCLPRPKVYSRIKTPVDPYDLG